MPQVRHSSRPLQPLCCRRRCTDLQGPSPQATPAQLQCNRVSSASNASASCLCLHALPFTSPCATNRRFWQYYSKLPAGEVLRRKPAFHVRRGSTSMKCILCSIKCRPFEASVMCCSVAGRHPCSGSTMQPKLSGCCAAWTRNAMLLNLHSLHVRRRCGRLHRGIYARVSSRSRLTDFWAATMFEAKHKVLQGGMQGGWPGHTRARPGLSGR